jgi:DNA polymerase III epsilon subunit-like protein
MPKSIYDISNYQQPLFLDFEASSLALGSFPIEIGATIIEQSGEILTQSRLIVPHRTWNMNFWSPESEQIHNIPHGILLSKGEEADTVAHWFEDISKNHLIISDNPEFEAMWLKKLNSVTDIQMPQVHDIDALFAQTLESKGLDMAYEYLSKTKVPHRAGPDSLIMATAWQRGRETDAGLRPVSPS